MSCFKFPPKHIAIKSLCLEGFGRDMEKQIQSCLENQHPAFLPPELILQRVSVTLPRSPGRLSHFSHDF